mgnify:CR=1 FL=1
MKVKTKLGFTLVEVALFLAATGILFIGIVAGIQGSMFQQRYNDSVQSFAEFLRTTYSQAINVQNSKAAGGGRTEKAVYGKLIVFNGESSEAINSYTVIGDIQSNNSSDCADDNGTLGALKCRNANIYEVGEGGNATLAGISEEYYPRWQSRIETTKGWDENNKYEAFNGAILIVRHPNSGTVFTYVLHDDENNSVNVAVGGDENPLTPFLEADDNGFEIKQVDFCVDPNGNTKKGIRRDIRILQGARSAAGVKIIDQDGEDNKCAE